MNNYFDLFGIKNYEIEEMLSSQSELVNQKHFEFLMIMIRLFDNLIDFEEFEKFYNKLFEGLNEDEVNSLDKILNLYSNSIIYTNKDKILKLEVKNIIEFKDKNNLWVKEKKLTQRKKGNDKNE